MAGAEEADIETLPVDEKYKALLRLSVKLTTHAHRVIDEDMVDRRAAGLTGEEILEGIWVACQFKAVDRLADTFGLYDLMQLQER